MAFDLFPHYYVLHALVSLVAFLLVGNAKVYGEGRGGAGRRAARLTHTSLVAVSQDTGEGFHIERRASRLPP